MTRPLALTAGEPAGIGPDLCIQWAQSRRDTPVVVLADRTTLLDRAGLLGLSLIPDAYQPGRPPTTEAGHLTLLDLPQASRTIAGRLDPANARFVLNTLDRAIDGCLAGEFSAMVTAPVHKGIINDAGIPFTGHTEYLAERTHTPHVVMMLTGAGMRVALASTHLPLRAVADAITPDSLRATLRILHQDLVSRFRIADPHILVAGLNPHAGEDGHLGDEEIRVITPVLDELRASGMHLTGPLPADTLFHPARLATADAVLAMYHDQGLPVLKHASFGEGINITLGLPVIRTSVDHGTAVDLAGTGRADTGSLQAALSLAARLASEADA